MARAQPERDSSAGGAGSFRTTHWSLVIAAGGQSGSSHAYEALSKLCETYWYPLYAFLRRKGCQPEEAKDLTQGFFCRMMEKNFIQSADPEKGRFRSFLLACLQHYLSNEKKKEHAGKRGGGAKVISLDDASAEERYMMEPADPITPEDLYERDWALTVLDKTMSRLKQEYTKSGRGAQFAALQVYLSGGHAADISYAKAGEQLGLSENAARQAAYRLRIRFGVLLRLGVAQTVANPAEINEEMNHLAAVLSR
jgi:RNA polymerase sigma factor (sigma-70 family)